MAESDRPVEETWQGMDSDVALVFQGQKDTIFIPKLNLFFWLMFYFLREFSIKVELIWFLQFFLDSLALDGC